MSAPSYYVDIPWDIVETGEALNILTKRGNTYYFGEEKVGGSRDKAESAMLDNLDLAIRVSSAITEHIHNARQTKEKVTDGGSQDTIEASPASAFPGSTPDFIVQESESAVHIDGSERDAAIADQFGGFEADLGFDS